MEKRFGSAAAFKASLEAHLRKRAEEGSIPFSTLQLKVVIERLLARLFRDPKPPWLLKGGFAMDLRYRPQARTTKDVDLSIALVSNEVAVPDTIREMLQTAVDIDLGDYLVYRIGKPKQELTIAPKGGARYPCEAVLVGKTYARFQIDVGCGDALVGAAERLIGEDFLRFAGVGPARVLAISKAQQFAEKVHAYAFPWSGRLNTRTKDLVDLVLLIERSNPDVSEVRRALEATFSTRATHPLPEESNLPPRSWAADFTTMAAEAGLSTTEYLKAFATLSDFWTKHSLGKIGE
jgi:hypothetical protein